MPAAAPLTATNDSVGRELISYGISACVVVAITFAAAARWELFLWPMIVALVVLAWSAYGHVRRYPRSVTIDGTGIAMVGLGWSRTYRWDELTMVRRQPFPPAIVAKRTDGRIRTLLGLSVRRHKDSWSVPDPDIIASVAAHAGEHWVDGPHLR